MEAAQHPWPALGVLLLRDGLVSKDELEAILSSQPDTRQQRITGSRLGEILVEQGAVSAAQVARLLAEQYELPFMDLDVAGIDVRAAHALTVDEARRFSAVPINERPDGAYDIAIADPSTVVFSDQLRQILGSTVHFVVVGNDAIAEAIADVYSRPDPRMEDDEGLGDSGEVAAIRELKDVFPRSGALAQLWPPLGALLVRDGFVSDDDLQAALAQQRLSTTQRLGEILVERGVVSRAVVARLVAEQYELPFVELSDREIDVSTARLLPEELARKYRAIPIAQREDGSLEVAIADPTSVFYSDDLNVELNAPLTLLVAAPDEIDALVARVHTAADTDDAVMWEEPGAVEETGQLVDEVGFLADEHETDDPSWFADVAIHPAPTAEDDGSELDGPADLAPSYEMEIGVGEAPPWTTDVLEVDTVATEDEPSDALAPELHAVPDPVEEADADSTSIADLVALEEADSADDVGVVSDDLVEAVQRVLATGTSVLHLSHRDDVVDVRARIDGVLETIGAFPDDDLQPVIDALTDDPTVQLRSMPTSRGAKITVSAVERHTAPTSLGELGMSPTAEQVLRESLEHPGVVLIGGPAGNGVTTTLYAALEALAAGNRVVATIEDRIVRTLDDVDQTEIDGAGDVTFATGLRRLWEMDADVVLVSALPDTEAVDTALRCGLSGCHVLAGTTETDAASAAVRLLELAGERDRLARGLTCVVSQCLVPRVCSDCRETYYASPSELDKLGLPHDGQRLLARGRGCRSCGGSGSRGHAAVFEVLTMTDDIGQIIRSAGTPSAIREAAAAAGVQTIQDEAIRLCLEGLIATADLDRVLELRAF